MKLKEIKKFIDGLRSVAFPSVCACCGFSTAGSGRHICEWCREQRFESPKTNEGELLPRFILHRFSMWSFDKGGVLQDLLHGLKYHHLKDVGLELGEFLGDQYMSSLKRMENLCFKERIPVIIPVPLHKRKQRKRGYNQARVLADGMSRRTGWPVIPEQSIVRVKYTKTQTGLTSSERQHNLDGAFKSNHPLDLERHIPVLVDDVYTTGATTFELASVLNVSDTRQATIVTVASA